LRNYRNGSDDYITYHMAVQHEMEALFEEWNAPADEDAEVKVKKLIKDAVSFQGKIYDNNTVNGRLLGFSWEEALDFLEDK
jgi:hypothetical protein